jgi:hypothetical protein
MSGMDDQLKSKMKAVALSHCKDGKWSDDVVQCMSEAKADTDLGFSYQHAGLRLRG